MLKEYKELKKKGANKILRQVLEDSRFKAIPTLTVDYRKDNNMTVQVVFNEAAAYLTLENNLNGIHENKTFAKYGKSKLNKRTVKDLIKQCRKAYNDLFDEMEDVLTRTKEID